ncbi:hypothetical protein FJ955_08145 [Mesorhizobium sp. B2-2-2]|nr:hypothetical protein FJ955_08145 [Mesorhizobium sp. B2-2-2]
MDAGVATAPFSPFTGRRCRQADEGSTELTEPGAAPHPARSGHLLPVNGEKGRKATSCSSPSSPAVPWSGKRPIDRQLPWPSFGQAALPGNS